MPKSEAYRPQRSCIACRRKDDPATFFRVSRLAGGRVVIWGPGVFGRSAYLCRTEECLGRGLSKRLTNSLRTGASPAEIETLRKELECKLR